MLRKVRPGVDLNEEIGERYPGQALGDTVSKGRGTRGAGLGLQRRQDEAVLLDPDVAVFAPYEPFDLCDSAL